MVETLITGVITNLLTDAVYAGYKNAKQLKRNSPGYRSEIEGRIAQFLSDYKDSFFDSSTFCNYLELPQVSDTIRNYVLYIAAGKYAKGKKTFTDERAVIDYLTENALAQYREQLTVPDKREIENFFLRFFDVSREFYFNRLNIRDQSVIFFINQKISALEEKIENSLAKSVKSSNAAYSDILCRYRSIVKKKNQSLFVYGYRELKLEDFYVVPRLVKKLPENVYIIGEFMQGPKEKSHTTIHPEYRRDILMHLPTESDKEIFTYTDIFRTDNIVYVVGGPGYGKSILLKNIIVNSEKMFPENRQDHLVICCDLKTFYKNPQGSVPSVTDFLIESIVEESGMSRSEITEDFINYYLSIGRTVILLDALDEVPKQYRENLHKKITSYFLSCNPNNKVCITSRDRGFYPQNEIEVFQIMPLSSDQIGRYLDNMIRLRYFNQKDKETFLRQAESLIQQEFLNSFLILSLLVNIFKAENELPQTKVELYSKCFSYISRDREREKNELDKKYDWDNIMKLMKDSTFIELSKLACPNNKDIGEEIILENLSRHYKRKFGSIDRAETAVMELLRFCSERTELFVPAAQEGAYCFFHRSFFEYFYAKYTARLKTPREIVREFKKFDIDSEVFELTAALLKNDDESLYQDLVQYIIDQAEAELSAPEPGADMLNILILIMQVVDDEEYIHGFCRLFIDHSQTLVPVYLFSPVEVFTAPCIRNEHIVRQLLLRYTKDNAKLADEFYDKYHFAAFLSATDVLGNFDVLNSFVIYPSLTHVGRSLSFYNLLRGLLRRSFFSAAVYRHPDWPDYFINRIQAESRQDLPPIPGDSAETDIKNRKREHYARQIQHLSDMSSEQLKQVTDLLFCSS